MKRLWLILLSLGLIAAFSTQAMAVDVKVSGEFYAAGLYLDKTTLNKTDSTKHVFDPSTMSWVNTPFSTGPSTAFYFQRLRLTTTFVVSPGLTLTTRMDIMERAWGASRTSPGTGLDTLSAGTKAENENIAFDLAYVTYVSPIGIFLAGYQIDGAWGTVFGDNSTPLGKVGYKFIAGGLTAGVQMGKNNDGENSYTAKNAAIASDRDSDFYTIYGLYAWKGGEAGVLGKYIRSAAKRASDYTSNYYLLLPYFKTKLGPVFLQGELDYGFGQAQKKEAANVNDTRFEQVTAWLDATADFGMFYAGGTLAYVEGQDPGSGAITSGVLNGGIDWNPCLIMFNSDTTYWAGAVPGYDYGSNAVNGVGSFGTIGAPMTNAWFFQVRGGVRPIEKLDIMASVSFANADKKPHSDWLYNDYGYEVDLTATYKITNNLSYMLGGGYLFTGKYFRGVSDTNEVANNFMVINKLTLTF